MTARRASGAAAPPAVARVAFQGEAGAYSEEAVRRLFGAGAEPVPRREFADVGSAVLRGEVDFGLLPVENTLAGGVAWSYDVLAATALEVHAEVVVPIHHCVLGVPGARLDALERVLSHPVALAQCTRFLRSRAGVEAVAVYDTAGAARDVAAAGDPRVGAIASRAAAERYGLEVLAREVEDRPDNQTRFLVVAPPGAARAPLSAELPGAGRTKTSLVAEAANRPGALVELLLPFSERGVNLTRLESRPAGEPWTYRFFIELEGDASGAAVGGALGAVRERARRLRVLGSYPSWTVG